MLKVIFVNLSIMDARFLVSQQLAGSGTFTDSKAGFIYSCVVYAINRFKFK